MKHSRKVFALIMTLAMVFTMSFATVGVSAATSGKVGAVKWNKAKKTVSFEVTVNKKMLNGAAVTHFIINDKNGKKATGNAGAGLFTTKATALDLYKALVKAGATPWVDKYEADALPGLKGNIVGNANLGNLSYSKLTMTFKKGKKTYKPQQLVNYKKEGNPATAPIEMCFSGNYANQNAWNTGCVACIFSCFAGVTSNQVIDCGSTNEAENYFYASNKLKAGDKYTVTYKINAKDTADNYITAGEFRKGMAKYALIDVRPEGKWNEGHINGAYKASFGAASETDKAGVAALTAAVNQYGKDATYVLCCNTGRGYAAAATKVLKSLGVKNANIKTLCGGYENWKVKFPETLLVAAAPAE